MLNSIYSEFVLYVCTILRQQGIRSQHGCLPADIHSWADDFARGKRIKNFEVVCPGSIIWEDKNTSMKDLKIYWVPIQFTSPPRVMRSWPKSWPTEWRPLSLRRGKGATVNPVTRARRPVWSQTADWWASAAVTPLLRGGRRLGSKAAVRATECHQEVVTGTVPAPAGTKKLHQQPRVVQS